MTTDYIKRQAALHAVNEFFHDPKVDIALNAVPAENVRENVRAMWIKCDYKELDHQSLELVRARETGVCCSNCRRVFRANMLGSANFCPECGANMVGVENDG